MNKNKYYFSWFILLFLSLVPILPWYLMILPISLRFYNTAAIFASIGQLTGLVGMTMFCLTMILNGRSEIIEGFFGGKGPTHHTHHILGGISFLLLLIHPLILAATYALTSFNQAALFLLPGDNWQINLGSTALILMITFIYFTFFVNIRYTLWRFYHKFMSLAYVFACLHTYFISSDISRNPGLRYYVFILIGFGLASVINHTILHWNPENN